MVPSKSDRLYILGSDEADSYDHRFSFLELLEQTDFSNAEAIQIAALNVDEVLTLSLDEIGGTFTVTRVR